jgi:hypothetical protein
MSSSVSAAGRATRAHIRVSWRSHTPCLFPRISFAPASPLDFVLWHDNWGVIRLRQREFHFSEYYKQRTVPA